MILAYAAFILCWAYIFQTRSQLDGTVITLQEADHMNKFSSLTMICEWAIYIIFLVFALYEWMIGEKKIIFLMKRELTALVLLFIIGGLVVVGYKCIIPSAEIVMNFFEPIFICIVLTFLCPAAFKLLQLRR